MYRLGKLLLAATIATSACGGGGAPQAAQVDPILTVRVATGQPTAPYWTGALVQSWTSKIGSDTGGKVSFQKFENSTLYSDSESLQALSNAGGGIEMAVISTTTFNSIAPAAKVFDLPYVFRVVDSNTWSTLAGPNTPIGARIQAESEKKGVHMVSGYFVPPLGIYSKNPIPDPTALKGLRLKSAGASDIYRAVASTLGYSAVDISNADVFTALRQGVVDGAFANDSFMATNPDTWNYATTVGGLQMAGLVVLVNHSWWKKLPKKYQDIFTNDVATVNANAFQMSSDSLKTAHDKLVAANKKYSAWSTSDILKAEQQTKPVWNQFRSSIGSDVVDSATKIQSGG